MNEEPLNRGLKSTSRHVDFADRCVCFRGNNKKTARHKEIVSPDLSTSVLIEIPCENHCGAAWREMPGTESGPLRAVHSSRHEWPEGLVT